MTSTETANSPRGEVLLALKLGGALSRSDLAVRTGLAGDVLTRELGRLLDEGTTRQGSAPDGPTRHRLTDAGAARAERLLAAERAAFGGTVASVLDEFDASNRALKEMLHRWQLRPEGSALVVNDHSDERWDARILVELGDLIVRARSWLDRLPRERSRYARYRARLEAAVDRAGQGDLDFVAGLAVDSVHSVWWQLHADLLALAGRARGEADA